MLGSGGGGGARRTIAVVPHTHWDREWYEPFAEFRRRLVILLDGFLAHLDRDPTFRCFLLDGQLAVVDDYLSVRPGAEESIRRLVGAGRLAIGPWYILMDEFLVSGETIVRNLQLGLERAATLGGAMEVGYLPDMFGHIAQMPQVLRAAGLDHAVVWRGVPAAVDRTGFWWRSPDGSTVRAEYLPVGYSNGAHLPEDPAALAARLRAEEAVQLPFLDGGPLLVMAGTDHQVPQTGLPGALDALERTGGPNGTDIDTDTDTDTDTDGSCPRANPIATLTSLERYLAEATTEALPSWTGELRSSARANLLMGVVSNRTDIRAAAARTERWVEQMAEPLATLWSPTSAWPAEALTEAWLAMIHNSAHDSICACSHDEVGATVLHRFGHALALAEGIVRTALHDASHSFTSAGTVVVNPAPTARSGVVELLHPGPTAPPGTQVVEAVPPGSIEAIGTGADLARLRGELTDSGWPIDDSGQEGTVTSSPGGIELQVEIDLTRPASTRWAAVLAEADALAGASPTLPLRISARRAGWQRVLARVEAVPGFGWTTLPTGSPDVPVAPDIPPVPALSGGLNWLANDRVHLAVNPADGTFAINGLSGLDRLVDSGDEGDTYNYSPPADDVVVDRPEAVTVEVREAGPLRGRLRVTRRFRWPERIEAGVRVGQVDITVVTDLELRAGEALVRVETSFDHRHRDHRLRALFPLPQPASTSTAECAFATIERGLVAEGGPGERALPTYPARRFVSAGGLTLTQEGVAEYELIDGGRTLALTLVRATGMLSRPAPTFRPNSAGPQLRLEGPQMIGPFRVRYALAVGDLDPYRLADLAWLPLPVLSAPGGGTLGPQGSRLTVSGAEVSSLRRVAGGIELRVFNPSPDACWVAVGDRDGWLTDLRGRPLESFTGGFPLRPWGIATARIPA
jgi:mannosylglycerate hydrolase